MTAHDDLYARAVEGASTPAARDLRRLLSAWDSASEAPRAAFLHVIGADPPVARVKHVAGALRGRQHVASRKHDPAGDA